MKLGGNKTTTLEQPRLRQEEPRISAVGEQLAALGLIYGQLLLQQQGLVS
jgi:hypothetical protein